MVLDLATFILSLSVNLFSSVLMRVSLSIAGKSSQLKCIVVTSAYIKYENLVLDFTMSLMYMLRNNGPNIEPCGIPVLYQTHLIECCYISQVGNYLISNF